VILVLGAHGTCFGAAGVLYRQPLGLGSPRTGLPRSLLRGV
jgi:hypothetical protein